MDRQHKRAWGAQAILDNEELCREFINYAAETLKGTNVIPLADESPSPGIDCYKRSFNYARNNGIKERSFYPLMGQTARQIRTTWVNLCRATYGTHRIGEDEAGEDVIRIGIRDTLRQQEPPFVIVARRGRKGGLQMATSDTLRKAVAEDEHSRVSAIARANIDGPVSARLCGDGVRVAETILERIGSPRRVF